jgi:hypothetical protein
VAAKAIRTIIDRFCGGSVESLLVGMIESEVTGVDRSPDFDRRYDNSEEHQEHACRPAVPRYFHLASVLTSDGSALSATSETDGIKVKTSSDIRSGCWSAL